MVEGLGNRFSDVDIFVVGPAPSQRKPDMWVDRSTRRWVDLQRIGYEQIQDALDQVNRNGGRFPSDFGTYDAPRLAALDLYHRMRIAVPLTHVDALADLRDQFDKDLVARELCFVHLIFARSAWQDAVGAFLSAHFSQAAYVAKRIVEHAVDAYSALLGETYAGEKWRWARLTRITIDPLRLKARDLDFTCHVIGMSKAVAEERMIIARDLLYQVMHLANTGAADCTPPPLSQPTWRLEFADGKVFRLDETGAFR